MSRGDFLELFSSVAAMREEFLKISQVITAARDVGRGRGSSVSPHIDAGGSDSSFDRGSVSSMNMASLPQDMGSVPGVVPSLDDLAEINLGLNLDGDDLEQVPQEAGDVLTGTEATGDLLVVLEGDESVGPPVSGALAGYVTTCASKRIEREHLKSLRLKAKRPASCSGLVTPQVDPVIWRELDRFQCSCDVNMQTSQELLVKGLQLVVGMNDKLLAASRTNSGSDPLLSELSTLCTSAIALQANASLESSFRHQELLRSSLSRRCHALCGTSTPLGAHLFGDEIAEDLKEIIEANKVSRGIVLERQPSAIILWATAPFFPVLCLERTKLCFAQCSCVLRGPHRSPVGVRRGSSNWNLDKKKSSCKSRY